MADVIRYPESSDPTTPIPSDWTYHSNELYSATPENSTDPGGRKHVRDLRTKLENLIKGCTSSGSPRGDQGISDVVQEILMVDAVLQEKYGKLALADLIKKNKIVKGKDGLPLLSAALGILEKYGRNLLKPNRPAQWKTISFSNAVFRTRVDIIKGSRDILKLLGYTEVVVDGVRFPDTVQAPDVNTVVMVTADLILGKAEIDAYTKRSHPHPYRVKECVEGTVAAILYPRSDTNSPNSNGGTVYVRQSTSPNNQSAKCDDTRQPTVPLSDTQLPMVPMRQPVVQPMQSGRPPPTSQPVVHQATQPGRAPMISQQQAVEQTRQPGRARPTHPGAHQKPPYAPKPAWMQDSQSSTVAAGGVTVGGVMSQVTAAPVSPLSDNLVCALCGEDSATKECNTCPDRFRCEQCDVQWHKHPSRKSHRRRDVYPVIHDPNTPSTESVVSSPCSVCGDNEATQHCEQCKTDFCEACGKKMHLHPKRKNHILQLLPGANATALPPQLPAAALPPQLTAAALPPQLPGATSSPRRQPPDGRSIRGSTTEEPAPLAHLEIRRPESLNDQRILALQNVNVQQLAMDQNQQGGDGYVIPTKPSAHMPDVVSYQQPASHGPRYQQPSPAAPDVGSHQQQASKGTAYPQQSHLLPDLNSRQQQAEFHTPAQRKRPVPKPRVSLGKSPTSPASRTEEFGRQINMASLATNIGSGQHHPNRTAPSPTSPNADPRELEMQNIMSRDVNLLERISDLRNNLKSLQRSTPQYTQLTQMESSLWDEHKELLERQAVLEQSLKGPPVPAKRGQSMMVEIRRPPVGDKPLSVIPDEDTSRQKPKKPSGKAQRALPPRSQSARRVQEDNAHSYPQHPPSSGWECIPCGYINNGDKFNCECCGALYGAPINTNQPRQGPDAALSMRNQTSGEQPAIKTPPHQEKVHQQAKIHHEGQLPGGVPTGIGNKKLPAKPSWNCQKCTYSNRGNVNSCQMCGVKKTLEDVTGSSAASSAHVSPPSSPKTPVQRQQTEDEKGRQHLTAYEYMQAEEEAMLKEKQRAKALDDAQHQSSIQPGDPQGHSIYDTPPRRNTENTPSSSRQAATASISDTSNSRPPPTLPVIKQKPEPLTAAMETLKLNRLEGDRSSKDMSADTVSSSISPNSMNIQLTQERRILAEQATEGLAFVNILRQAETNNFCVEDVTVASMAIQETQVESGIVPWLQQNWDDYKSTATAQATNALNLPGGKEWIQLSEEEVVEALYKHDGHIEEVVNECVTQRNQKIAELESYGFETAQAAKAISRCDGDVDKALMKLQEAIVSPLVDGLWNPDEEDTILYEKLKTVPSDNEEYECYLRLLLAEFNISSWGRAITATRLIRTEKYQTKDAITAASECGDYERARQFLEKECNVCYGVFPHNQLMSLSHCQDCLICSECLAEHFKIVIQSRSIIHATCPACNKPDAKDAQELAEYFTFLDSWLRTLLDEETHALFQHKLRDWNLQKEENFRWCAHCRNGFINEAPERRKMRCPECANITCFNCKKPWMDQHENITCLEFEQWKQDNDPEKQEEGVAYHLKVNGIECPQCKMRYELAKGGCMHFKCTQCMFEFCCGCNKPFLNGAECKKFPSCANRGLHSHHPRDCLFHLRDWIVPDLQKLLQNHDIPYDTNPPQAQGKRPDKGCSVMEQKETPEGLNDGPCGREAPALHAGLCRIHYLEYLVGLINQNMIDPAETFTPDELTIVLRRNEVAVPPRPQGGALEAYKQELLATVQEELPFDGKPPRERP